jgi:hypothetical protein
VPELSGPCHKTGNAVFPVISGRCDTGSYAETASGFAGNCTFVHVIAVSEGGDHIHLFTERTDYLIVVVNMTEVSLNCNFFRRHFSEIDIEFDIELLSVDFEVPELKDMGIDIPEIKEKKIKDISDVRDEIDINGFKMAIDLKRGSDPEKLMQKLFKLTKLEDDFKCNFNILVGGIPQTMGIKQILEEWCAFRIECLRRTYIFDLSKKSDNQISIEL